MLRAIIRRFDHWMSSQNGVQVFTNDTQCLLRIQISRTTHLLNLPDGEIPNAAKALILHMWNERALLIPPQGPNLAWALDTCRRMKYSLRLLGQHIQAEPSLRDIQVVGGITAHIHLHEADGGKTLLEHLGFNVMPYNQPSGDFGEFWENFYTWWLMWTYNPASLRHRKMTRLQRTEFWMSKKRFLALYL